MVYLDGSDGYDDIRRAWIAALRLNVRVIAALVRRETRAHFGEHRLGYLWAIIEPTLHLSAFIILFSYVLGRRSPLGGNLTLFLLTGLVPYFLYYKLATYLTSAIASNKALLNLPPVKPIDVLVSRAIIEASTYLLVGVLMMTGLFLIDGVREAIPWNPLNLAGAILASVTFGFGMGTINSAIQSFVPNWATLVSYFLGPLYLLSGVWFMPDQMPPPLRDYLLYNPILHLILWFRSGFYPPNAALFLDRGYALTWALSVVIVGLVLQRVLVRRILEPS